MPSPAEIREKLAPLFDGGGLQLAFVFGSAVSGHTHGRSDIDLAFLPDGPLDIVALTNDVSRLLGTDSVDLVDLRRAGPLLKYAVARSGMLLYEREQGMFSSFYSLALRRYVDTRKLRSAQESAIRNFLEARGLA